MKRLALTVDGKLTYCTAPEDKIGVGRCNHAAHQTKDQSAQSFTESVLFDEETGKYTIKGVGPKELDPETNTRKVAIIIEGLSEEPENNDQVASDVENHDEEPEDNHKDIVATGGSGGGSGDEPINPGLHNSSKGKMTEEFEKLASLDTPNVFLKEDGNIDLQNAGLMSELRGMNHKGSVILEDQNGDKRLKFIKIDEISPTKGKRFLDEMSSLYSSVLEDLGSSFASSIKDEEFKSVEYEFKVFDRSNKKISGTLSDNFLYSENGDEIHEQALSQTSDFNPTIVQPGCLIPVQDYAEKIIDIYDNGKILDNMVQFYEQAGVDKDKAREFILKQAAFDLTTCNSDRRENPSNTTFLTNARTGETSPINMDFGRVFSGYPTLESYKNLKTKTMETFVEEFGDDAEKELLDEISEMHIDLSTNVSIFKGDRGEVADFLLKSGYEPMEIDKNGMEAKLSKLEEKVDSYDSELNLYAKSVTGALRKSLSESSMRKLWKEG